MLRVFLLGILPVKIERSCNVWSHAKDKRSATESVAWMVFVSVGGSFVIILAALTILNALELFDVMIAAGTAVASARMIVPWYTLRSPRLLG